MKARGSEKRERESIAEMDCNITKFNKTKLKTVTVLCDTETHVSVIDSEGRKYDVPHEHIYDARGSVGETFLRGTCVEVHIDDAWVPAWVQDIDYNRWTVVYMHNAENDRVCASRLRSLTKRRNIWK